MGDKQPEKVMMLQTPFSLGNPYGRKTTLKCKHALLSLFWYGKYVSTKKEVISLELAKTFGV